MRRPDEHAETILELSPKADDAKRPDETQTDDSELRKSQPGDAPAVGARSAEDSPAAAADRTQFVDPSEFLEGDEFAGLAADGETIRLRTSAETTRPERDEVPEPTLRDFPRSPGDEAERGSSGVSQDDRTVLSSDGDQGADTTYLGVHAGATVLTPPTGSPSECDPRTIRPADSRTLWEGGDASETTPRTRHDRAVEAAVRGGDGWRHYEFVEEIAHGGMGRIWRATDVRIRREVAFKELLPEALREPEAVERFVEEAQVTGQLEHPGIVPVYELGRQESGAPFYSMKLVAGGTLRDAIQAHHELPADSGERRLAFARLLRSFIAVCNAVGFAHERGVLHRDLKPLNIMLGDFGETLILDWGMAKVLGAPATGGPHGAEVVTEGDALGGSADSTGETRRTELELSQSTTSERRLGDHTHTRAGHSTRRHSVKTDARSAGTETQMGSVMGTPNYMAPEQALGLVDEFDARTDIYSLGAILYEILTGRPPVPKGKITEKLKFIIEGRTAPPRQIDATIPKPIEAVCLKAMAKRREERYQSALALAADVEAFLTDEPVSVYAEPWHVRARRWARRHRTAVTTSAAVAAVLIAAGAAWSAVESRRLAAAERDVEQNISEAAHASSSGDLSRAETLLTAAAVRAKSEPALAALFAGVEAQLANTRQLRLERLRRELDQKITEAESAIQTRGDYAAARTFLVQAHTAAQNQPELAEFRAETAGRLKAIENELAAQRARDEARDRFERFKEFVDRARFFGSVFRGENAQQDTAEAHRAALDALRLYNLERPGAADNPPPHLTDEQFAQLRSDAYEMLLVLSNAEVVLAWGAKPEEQQAAAERALEWIDKARSLGPTTKALLLREGGLLEILGRGDESARVREEASQTEPATALDYFLLAEAEQFLQNYSEALRLYQRALQREPNHFWSMHFTGMCHLLRAEQQTGRGSAARRGELEAAVASLTAGVGRRPGFVWNYLVRGVALAELERFDEALADFETARSLEPEMPGVYLDRGAVLLEQAQTQDRPELYEAAAADLRQAARLRPDRADPHTNLGELARRRGVQSEREQGAIAAARFYEQALTELTEAVRLAPGTAKPYRIRADVSFRLEQLEAAARDYRRAAELERSAAERSHILVELGRVYQFQRKTQPAFESYSEAVAANPQNADAHFYLAETLQALKQHAAAAESFAAFLKLSSTGFQPVRDGSEARPTPGENERQRAEPFMLAKAYRMRGEQSAARRNYRAAMEDYIRALERNPNSYESLARRGWAYLNEGARLALADFDEAIELNPHDADHWAGHGYALVVLGSYEQAVRDAARAAEVAREQIRAGAVQGWILLFNPATIYAQAVDRVEKDQSLTADQRRERADEYARAAVKLLQEAEQAAGTASRERFIAQLRSDSALDPIRSREEFQGAWNSPTGQN